MKKIIAKKLFDLGKTPIGDLIVGFAFGKFSKLLPVKKIKETDKKFQFLALCDKLNDAIFKF